MLLLPIFIEILDVLKRVRDTGAGGQAEGQAEGTAEGHEEGKAEGHTEEEAVGQAVTAV